MINEAKFRGILQSLDVRKRQALDPTDITETITYIAHVEHLLKELENALILNQLQARNIREYIEQPSRYHPPAGGATEAGCVR